MTTHNCPAYKTRTQVASQGGEELHTTALPTRLEHKSLVRGLGRENYTQVPCLQDSNTSCRSEMGERGDIHTTTLPTRQKSPVRGWRTTHNHATYKTRTQVTDEGEGVTNTTVLPIRLKHNLPIRVQGLEHKSPIRKGVTYI